MDRDRETEEIILRMTIAKLKDTEGMYEYEENPYEIE